MKMDSFTEDLWTMILARLPLTTITTSKLVCKKWKLIIESPFLREIFLSHHQNSHASWSLMCRDQHEEVVAHYGCEVWELPRSLGSYVSSLNDAIAALESKPRKRRLWCRKQKLRVLAYTDIGLVLLYVMTYPADQTYYVANPVTEQRIKIPPPPIKLLRFAATEDLGFLDSEALLNRARLVTRTENGVVLGYRVVVIETVYKNIECYIAFAIYSSETGLWTSNVLQSPLPLIDLNLLDPISLNGNLHWLGLNLDGQDVVVSYDFYGSDHHCRVIPFPDSEKVPKYKRSCTASGGNLMYMNIVSEEKDNGNLEHKFSVWKLKTGEWQLVSELTGFDYFPLAINPFDGNTVYLWSETQECLVSISLRNGDFELHNELECSRDGETLCSVQCNREFDAMEWLSILHFSMFVLPRWLYRIPTPPRGQEFIDVP